VINIIGGLAIGIGMHGLSFGEAGRLYSLLTIGDGLVAQIPAMFLSLATAIIVTRVTTAQSMTEQAQDKIMSMTKDMDMHRVLAIGAGVVVGAVVADAIFIGDVFVVAGGVAGGLVGAWWYDNADDRGLPRMAIRETPAVVMPAGFGFSQRR